MQVVEPQPSYGMTQLKELQDLKHRLENVELEVTELKSRLQARKKLGNPWARMAGMFANDPLHEEWREATAEYRREVDAREQLGES